MFDDSVTSLWTCGVKGGTWQLKALMVGIQVSTAAPRVRKVTLPISTVPSSKHGVPP